MIKDGSFEMGSNDGHSDEQPVHEVTLKSFWLGKYVVTQAQYEALMGINPSYIADKGGRNPEEKVSWEDAMAFCRRLSDLSGETYGLI